MTPMHMLPPPRPVLPLRLTHALSRDSDHSSVGSPDRGVAHCHRGIRGRSTAERGRGAHRWRRAQDVPIAEQG